MPRRYWLVKSEPETFSFDDLLGATNRTTHWDGVRNYAARNHLREMKKGDQVLFYHSSSKPAAIVGTAEVVREAYPDHTAFDPKDPHFDPKSKPESPAWFMVDLKALKPLAQPVTLEQVKKTKSLQKMALVRLGRLSVQPVTEEEWETVMKLGGRG
jgi:predicted RNA-binding protein with PUA-like domain